MTKRYTAENITDEEIRALLAEPDELHPYDRLECETATGYGNRTDARRRRSRARCAEILNARQGADS